MVCSCLKAVFLRSALCRIIYLWYLVPSLEFPFRLLDDTDTSITVPPFFHPSCFAELLEFAAFTRILSSLLHNLAQHGWKVIVRLSELAIYLYRKCASYD